MSEPRIRGHPETDELTGNGGTTNSRWKWDGLKVEVLALDVDGVPRTKIAARTGVPYDTIRGWEEQAAYREARQRLVTQRAVHELACRAKARALRYRACEVAARALELFEPTPRREDIADFVSLVRAIERLTREAVLPDERVLAEMGLPRGALDGARDTLAETARRETDEPGQPADEVQAAIQALEQLADAQANDEEVMPSYELTRD